MYSASAHSSGASPPARHPRAMRRHARRLTYLRRLLFRRDDRPVGQQHQALDRIAQFAHVARPRTIQPPRICFIVELPRRQAVAFAQSREPVCDQRRQVFDAFAQIRNRRGRDGDPVEEVHPEHPLRDRVLQIAVGQHARAARNSAIDAARRNSLARIERLAAASRVVIDSSAIRGMACRRSPPVGERSARAQARGSDHERRWCEPTHEIRQRRDRAMQRHATHGSPRGTCAAVSQPLAIANAMMLRSPLSPFFVQPCPSHFIRVRCRCPSRSRRARAWPG